LLNRYRGLPDGWKKSFELEISNPEEYERLYEEECEWTDTIKKKLWKESGIDGSKVPLSSLEEWLERLDNFTKRYNDLKKQQAPDFIIDQPLKAIERIVFEIRTKNYILYPADQEYRDKYDAAAKFVKKHYIIAFNEKYGTNNLYYDEDE
jgi:hypothetical protein